MSCVITLSWWPAGRGSAEQTTITRPQNGQMPGINEGKRGRKLIVNNEKRILFKVTRTLSIGFLAFLLLAITSLPVSLTTLTAGWS